MRWSVPGRALFLCLAIVSASLSVAQQLDVWSNGGAHPVPLKADTASEKCSGCHSEIGKGKYVHSAMTMGCTTCHQVENKAGGTQVNLVSPVTQLCLTCHPLSQDKVQHGPYREGDCVVCHSPHASDFPAHTRASTQDTCLGCHAQSRVKVDAKAKTVTVPWGVTLTFKQVQGCASLPLNAALTAGHPVGGHPVSGPNTALGANAPAITCLSCHKPHASNFAHLLPKTPPDPDMPLCKSCSLCVDCHQSM
jgi:predicted CXXCH cytochrome family protein